LCKSSFHSYDKIPDINDLKEGNVDFNSRFQRLQSMDTWLCCFFIGGKPKSQGKDILGGREAERQREKVAVVSMFPSRMQSQ
jgi:hypothetical protein